MARRNRVTVGRKRKSPGRSRCGSFSTKGRRESGFEDGVKKRRRIIAVMKPRGKLM
jgi:hypothetical protein